jgi:hypothetical protein
MSVAGVSDADLVLSLSDQAHETIAEILACTICTA